jgi:transcriptional regulator GlxA family with amidase domain
MGLRSEENHMVEKFENLLLSNLSSRDFNIENALNNVALSEDHFRVLFKKETGKTPLQYLTNKRIEYAKMLLKTRNLKLLKILEVARMSGQELPQLQRLWRERKELQEQTGRQNTIRYILFSSSSTGSSMQG